MAEFDVEMVGDSPGDIEQRLSETATEGRRRVNNALRKAAEEVKADLENTSPVDTGEYSKSWYIFPVENEEVWILNEADHAQYVMLPNTKFIGLESADLPAQGILHNVKGVARRNSDSYRNSIIEELQQMFSDLKVE